MPRSGCITGNTYCRLWICFPDWTTDGRKILIQNVHGDGGFFPGISRDSAGSRSPSSSACRRRYNGSNVARRPLSRITSQATADSVSACREQRVPFAVNRLLHQVGLPILLLNLARKLNTRAGRGKKGTSSQKPRHAGIVQSFCWLLCFTLRE